MSWWKEVTHIGHHISHGIDHALHNANKIGKKLFGNNFSFHAGYNSNDGFDVKVGPEAEAYMNQNIGITPPERQINDDNYQAAMVEQSRPQTVIGNIMNGQGYSRTTAKTANTLAQGGMTKDEVEAFNMRHPNETANIGG